MDPDQLGDSSRKRKSPVTPKSASPKRRGPDTASPSRIIEDVKAEERALSEEHASTSLKAPSSATAYVTKKLTTVPSTLEGDTLGQKHRHFNKLVEDAIANKNYELRNISSDDSDIDNLLKIEIASRNRNVDYIIEVMKSNDMLYAARAIKKSTWLITDPQYANIINPEYLHTHLLPSMNTKAFKKLMLHIRINLKDESRVESFFKYLSRLHDIERAGYCEYLQTLESYSKWLENCSIPFIDNTAKGEGISTISLYKRLLKRSPHFIAHQNSVREEFDYDYYEEYLLLLKSQPALVIKKLDDYDFSPNFGKKKSQIMMKHCPKKIFDNIGKYQHAIDLSVVAKYLKKKEIKKFLYEQTKETETDYLWHFNCLKHFIKNMPEEERFDFVKKLFIDKTEPLSEDEKNSIMINANIKRYQWFEFAPFNEALTELTKLIREETSPSERCAMLTILITCARKNAQNIKTLLLFYNNSLINELFTSKIQFVNNLLSQISTHEFDDETWNVLDQLFHSMEVYTESENDVQMCLESIVLYKVLHDEPVPEIVEEKLSFNTFEKVQEKLNQEQRSKMFAYLLNFVLAKLQSKNIANESDFIETIDQLENALTLMRDWGKDISKYPNVLQKIQELIKIRQENNWKTDMSCLYNVEKSYRKYMFEESLSLYLSEETCLNALKHKPQLLMRHDHQIDTLRTDDDVSLRRLLAKLRVYWPHSLAQHFTDAYLLHLNQPSGQKAVVSGLFTLLPQQQIIDMAKIHAPKYSKINWRKTDRTEIRIQKSIARHLHLSRPLMPLDTVLWYAKGDYLQHTVPSLNAILSQLNEAESRKYLPKLLDAPVSLQKFGLNLADTILKSEDLKTTYSKVWKSLNNDTIRVVFFMHTYKKVRYVSCGGTNGSIRQDLWEILTTFIDDLTAENCAEYREIFSYDRYIPISFYEKYNKKSNEISTSLSASAN